MLRPSHPTHPHLTHPHLHPTHHTYTSTPYTSTPYTSTPYTSTPYTSTHYTSTPYTSTPYTPYTLHIQTLHIHTHTLTHIIDLHRAPENSTSHDSALSPDGKAVVHCIQERPLPRPLGHKQVPRQHLHGGGQCALEVTLWLGGQCALEVTL